MGWQEMERIGRVARGGVDAALRRPLARRATLVRAGRGGRGMALLWHRVGPDGPQPYETVRTVALTAFEAQLDLLVQLGDVVPLSSLERRDLERPGPSGRPRFALTFDDDDPGHRDAILPVLRARGLPATFFLSGRWQVDAGPYWWEVLEDRIRVRGSRAVAADLGLPAELSPPRIASAIAGTPQADELDRSGAAGRPTMDAAHARALTDAGMEVGFHTRGHPVLPTLDDDRLASAVSHGRRELGDELGVPLERFAYPHGRVDRRVAQAIARAGFRSAWTTAKVLARPDDPPMLRGRWDLGELPLDRFQARVLRALAWPGR